MRGKRKSDIARSDPIKTKIIIPARLDHAFCSKRCAKRVWAQRQ